MTEIARQVIDRLVQYLGVRAERVTLESRLLHDLGMDGDDAVEFFRDIHECYGTDITALERDWQVYFAEEGGCLSGIAIVPGVAIGAVLSGWIDLARIPGFILASLFGLASLLLFAKLSGPPKQVPVTVGDVVAAVEAGAWPAIKS